MSTGRESAERRGRKAKAILLTATLTLRLVAFWTAWIGLTGVWIATLVSMSTDGSYRQWFDAAAVIVLLYVLAIAEGLELAVTDLLDKQPEQLHDTRIRGVLRELQRRPGDFFSNRQIFVVAIISFATLMTTYPWIQVPLLGRISQEPLPAVFSFGWTTLTVLWFSQVTPKRLAITNSELFLGQSAFLLPVIKLVGLLGIPSASDQLVAFFENFTKYGHKRHLQPSPTAYYNATGLKFGVSLDRVHVEIIADDDGSATIRRRVAVCFLHGKQYEHSEAIFCRSGFSKSPRVRMIGLFTGLAPERLETIANDLDAILVDPQAGRQFRRVESWPHMVHVQVDPDIFYGGEWARWTILSGRPLPEAFWPSAERVSPSLRPMAALVYEVEFSVAPGGLITPDTSARCEQIWPEYVDSPCRALTFVVRSRDPNKVVASQGCDVRLLRNNAIVAQETVRCSELAIASHDNRIDISYPMQGAVYALRWWQMEDQQLTRELSKTLAVPPRSQGTDMTGQC